MCKRGDTFSLAVLIGRWLVLSFTVLHLFSLQGIFLIEELRLKLFFVQQLLDDSFRSLHVQKCRGNSKRYFRLFVVLFYP